MRPRHGRAGVLLIARTLLSVLIVVCAAPDALGAQALSAQSRSASEEIHVTADQLSVRDGGRHIEAQGDVEITRQETTLKADQVQVDRATQDVQAQGKVSVDDPDWKIKSAESLQLNLENETGEIQNGELFIEDGHVSITGRRFQKFTGQSYHIDDGFFTTCLCDSGPLPWRISAESLDLAPDGLGSVEDAYFYVLDVPVFYLPYGFFPVRTDRQTGFLFPRLAYSSRDGFRLIQPFFWAISKSTDATVSVDFETRARAGLMGEFRTIFRRDSDLQIHSSYFNESLRTREEKDIEDPTIADPVIPVNRWSVMGTHRYWLPSQWLTYSDVARYSDDLFARELIDRLDVPGGREDDIQRSRYSRSRFGFYRSWRDTQLRGEWAFFQDFIQPDATTLQRTPEVVFSGRRFLDRFPLEFRWNAGAVNYIRRRGGDGLRFDLRPELVLPFRLESYVFGGLSVAPRETLYHLYALADSKRNIARELVEIRGVLGTSLSRVFAWDGPSLSRIKHVIEPEVSYLFVPRTEQEAIPIMDHIDRVNRRNVLTFALSNRFWGKFAAPIASDGAPDTNAETLNPAIATDVQQLGSLRLALAYDIDKERKRGDSLSDLDVQLRVRPVNYLTFELGGGVNPGPWNVTQARAIFAISDPRPLARRSLDPDFNRPNAVALNYHFLRRGPNSLLAENANLDLDSPPSCPDRLDPRCTGFNRNTVGNLSGNAFYHATDHVLLFFSSTYNVRDSRFNGIRVATKILSQCECWSVTLGLKKEINPARTSVNFDFNLLGLGTPRSTLR
ncbi:MAG TPA: LPS assembly protein LptD [Candidatus Eisenbacteria bacterium]|nr:LPS assembly protein LptD [Candidatus Eisenbacteria bacterium]